MYDWNQLGRTSLYRCHQAGAFASSTMASTTARSSALTTPYSVSRSSTSRRLKPTRPSSMRLILDPDARMV
jgi:hypothetical protein